LGAGRLNVKVSRSHTDTHPTELLCTSDQPVAEAATYTTHNRQKRRTSVPSVGFEQAIPAIKWPRTYAQDCTATMSVPATYNLILFISV